MLFYIISEESTLASDSLGDNKKLENIIELKINYKIPLFILLTNADNYCKKVRSQDDENWKQICKNSINNNKNNLLSYINKVIEKNKIDFKTDLNEFTVLVEHKKITDDEAIKKMPKRTRDKYEKESDKEKKKDILEPFIDGLEADENEIKDFFEEEEINILKPNELIEKIKEKLPSQYHTAFKIY